MRNKDKLTTVLYLLSGVLFILAAILGKNYVFIPIGCCFIILGITNVRSKNGKEK